MAARFILASLLAVGFLLAGLMQYEISAGIITFSAEEYADYIPEAGYMTLYCRDYEDYTEFSEEVLGSESHEENASDHYGGKFLQGNRSDWQHLREAKVPFPEERRWEHGLYEAFLWGSLFGPLIGAALVSYLGPKRILEGGLLGASVATLLIPAAWKTLAHFALAIAQGICTSMMWPAAHVFAARWFEPEKRTSYISLYASWTAGWALAAFLGVILVDSIGRDSVFYATCLFVVFWYIAWQKYVKDLPSVPLTISWTERSLITTVTDEYSPDAPPPNVQQNTFSLKAFILSGPLWACALACFGSHYGLTTMLLAGIKYMQIVYGYSFSRDDVMSYLPFLGHFMCAVIFGCLADRFRSESYISTTTVRKILVYISHFLPGAIIFVFGYTGCDPSAPAALFTAALGLAGATPAGVYTSALEISPKYSGTVISFVQTLGAAGALSASYVIKEGLYGYIPGGWCIVFGISATVLVITAALFLIFGSGTEQQWNDPQTGVVHMTTLDGTGCDISEQQREPHQQNQQPDEIGQLNRKNQVFSL